MLMRDLALKIGSELEDARHIVEAFDDIRDTDKRTIQLAVAEICLMSAMEGLRKIKHFHRLDMLPMEVTEDAIAEAPPPSIGEIRLGE